MRLAYRNPADRWARLRASLVRAYVLHPTCDAADARRGPRMRADTDQSGATWAQCLDCQRMIVGPIVYRPEARGTL